MTARSGHAFGRRARLRHVSDNVPGISRRRRGKGFSYHRNGAAVSSDDRRRIRSLAIPPAWTRVWICAHPNGHLQATGYDARGRKQYRYHPRWNEVRNAAKFDDLACFGAVLPVIRRRVHRDIRSKGMSCRRVVACVVLLMDRCLIRVGNDEYARDNCSYGLTTMLNRHAGVNGAAIDLRFRAKSGILCNAHVDSPQAARIVRRCRELPGQELFCFVDDQGRTRDIHSGHVNSYIQSATGAQFTSKHFRTWGGSAVAAESLHDQGFPQTPLSQRGWKQREVAALDAAAARLSNTRAVCRAHYVHPRIFEADRAGELRQHFVHAQRTTRPRELRAAERALLNLLKE